MGLMAKWGQAREGPGPSGDQLGAQRDEVGAGPSAPLCAAHSLLEVRLLTRDQAERACTRQV